MDANCTRRASRWLVAGIFLTCAAFFPGILFTRDSWTMAETARSLAAFDGLALDGPSNDNAMQAPNGRWYSVYGFIQPGLSVPLVWAGWGLEWLIGQSAFNRLAFGRSSSEFFLPLLNVLITALIGWQLFRMLRRIISAKIACLVAISLCLSTLILTYSREFFVQPLFALLLLVSVDSAASLRRQLTYRHTAILAMGLSLMLLNRIDAVVACAILGTWFMWCIFITHHREPFPRFLRMLLLFASIVALGIAVEFAHNHLRSGDVLFLNRRPEKPFVLSPLQTLPDMLFNPYRSFFLYGPLVLLLLTRPRSWRPSALGGLCLGVSFAYFLFYSTYETYFGGFNPGPRLLLILYPLLFIVLGVRAQEEWPSRSFRAAWWVLFAAGLIVNVIESMLDYTQGPGAGALIASLFGVADFDRASYTGKALSATWAMRMALNGHWGIGVGYFVLTLSGGVFCLGQAMKVKKWTEVDGVDELR